MLSIWCDDDGGDYDDASLNLDLYIANITFSSSQPHVIMSLHSDT